MSDYDAADHVEDEMVGAVKVAVASGASAGMQMAKVRQERAQRAQEESATAARLDAQRREAMWQDSRSELQPIMQDEWWDKATPEDIGRAYATAKAWEGRDEAAPYAERMREQVRSRYGVDLDEVRPDEVTGELNLRDADRERAASDQERGEAERLMKEADQAEAQPQGEERQHDVAQAAEQDASAMYDSAERREAMAEDLMNRGVPHDAVDSRVRADAGQGAPSHEAARPSRSAPKARKGKGAQAAQQRDRARQR